jgi:superfamily II DNA or RNA helicase
MKVRIRKDIRIQGADAELREYLKELLTTANPEWITAKTFGRWTGNMPQFIHQFKEVGQDLFVPRGLYDHLLNDLGREWAEIVDERVTPEAEKIWPEGNIILRPGDQEPAVQELLSHDGGFLSAPAGSGKTIMGLEAARRLNMKALWLTHRKELKDQVIQETVDHLEIPKELIGVIHSKKWKVGEQLTIGMIPTMGKRDLTPLEDEFGVIIVDEGHHTPSRTFLQVVNQFASKYVYGLTATAYRRDELEAIMFNAIGPIVAKIDHVELIEDEHLMSPTIRRRATGWRPLQAREMEYHDLMKAMIHDAARNRLVVSDVLRECQPGNTCIVLVGRTRHAEILTGMLKDQGAHCEFVVGSMDAGPNGVSEKRGARQKKKAMPEELRNELIGRFKSGDLQVLVTTYDLLAEGFNYRPLNRLFMATPIKWKGRVVQAVGRVQRTAEGKTDALVYDYVDWDIGMFARQAEARFFSVYEEKGMRVEES